MSWLRDLRYAARSLRKSPGFTLIAAITLALGVGANTATFSVVNTVMLRPLPFAEPDRLVRIWERNVERGFPTFSFSHPNFLDTRSQAKSFESMAAWTNNGFTLTPANGDAEVIQGLNVTATFFETLRVVPALGRNFRAEEDRPGGNTRVAIISDGLWRRAFGTDPSVIGRSITLNSLPYTVIGVLPASFQWISRSDMIAPLAPDPARSRGDHRLAVIGRLAGGVSLTQATSELETIAAQLAQQYPEADKGWSRQTRSFYDWLVPQSTRQSLLVLLGAVGLVMLIACGNVVNLLLARGTVRQRELSIRIAMGASRVRVARQLLFESILLALIAAALGLALAFGAGQMLVALGPASVPRLNELSMDWRVAGFAIAIAVSTMVVFGLLPALSAARHDPQDALRADSRGSTGGTARRRIRSALTVAEVALSVALLIGAGLLVRSFMQLQQVDPGFKVKGTMTARLSLPSATYQTGASRWAFHQRMLEDLRARPGIEAAAIGSGPPMTGDFTGGSLRLPNQTDDQSVSTAWRLASPGYFAALGIPLRGREFSETDNEQAPPVAIISAAVAAKFFPNEDPLGRLITMTSFGPKPMTIVGVAGDVKTLGLEADAGYVFYGSTSQLTGWNPMSVVWRSQSPSSVDTVRASVRSIDAGVPLSAISSMESIVETSFGPRRFNLYLLATFAAVALLLAAIGLFGVMAYLVSQRTREIGVRLALGATSGEVFRLILGRGMALAGVGAILGLGAAFWLTRVMETLLFSVSRRDPVTFVVVPATLIAVAALACYLPARRAMRIDPVEALRVD